MKTSRTIDTATASKGMNDLAARLPDALRNRRALIVTGLLVLALGLTLNWGWLTAIGAAPILLSLAPCALMCTVGICCLKGKDKAGSAGFQNSDDKNVS